MTYAELEKMVGPIDRGLLGKEMAFPEVGLAGEKGIMATRESHYTDTYRRNKYRDLPMNKPGQPARKLRNKWERTLG